MPSSKVDRFTSNEDENEISSPFYTYRPLYFTVGNASLSDSLSVTIWEGRMSRYLLVAFDAASKVCWCHMQL